MSDITEVFIPRNGRNFKLRHCYDFAKATAVFTGLGIPDLVPVRDAFARNVLRQNSLFLMVLMSIQHSVQMERCLTVAEFEVTGKWDICLATGAPSLDVLTQTVNNFKAREPLI